MGRDRSRRDRRGPAVFSWGRWDGTGHPGRCGVEYRWFLGINKQPRTLEWLLLTVWSIKSALRELTQPLEARRSPSCRYIYPTNNFLTSPALWLHTKVFRLLNRASGSGKNELRTHLREFTCFYQVFIEHFVEIVKNDCFNAPASSCKLILCKLHFQKGSLYRIGGDIVKLKLT